MKHIKYIEGNKNDPRNQEVARKVILVPGGPLEGKILVIEKIYQINATKKICKFEKLVL